MAVTLRFQSSGAVPGDGSPIVMRGPSLTIGRGPENDVVLPDPDRMISKTHCVVENHNGSVVVVDFSTNGTFLNYGKIALGRTATPINDGDVLIMGPYELVVQISSASSYAEPLAPLADERASFGNARAAPDPYKLLDDAAPGGDFLDSLLGASKPKGPGQFRKDQEFVELLPPLGDDGPLLGPAPEMPMGPAMRDHSAAISDSFLPAQTAAAKSVIPDDWDDLLAPTPAPRLQQQSPLASGEDLYSHAPKPALPEDDDFFGLGPVTPPADPTPAPAPEIPPNAPPETPPMAPPEAPPMPPSEIPSGIPPEAPPGEQLPEDIDIFADLGPITPPVAPVTAATSAAAVAGSDPFATMLPPRAAPELTAPGAPFDPFATDPNRPSRSTSVPAASAVLEPDLAPPAQVVAAPVVAAAAATIPAPTPAPALQPTPAATAFTATVTGTDAARAFLHAVGADDLRISDAELPDTMARLGRTLKSMITGLREILMTRTSIKSEFRIEQTMVNVGGNNPLKFSISPEQAVEAMVKPTVRGYLPAEEAALQALEDIKAHEIAMVTGMEAALKGVLGKLDPAVLTSKIEAKGGLGGFLKNRKAQFWETYETMYAEISDQAENDFHELFAKEFAQAYRAQLARLKEAKTRG